MAAISEPCVACRSPSACRFTSVWYLTGRQYATSWQVPTEAMLPQTVSACARAVEGAHYDKCLERAGVLILIDIILNFNVGVVVQHNLRALYGM